MKHRAKLQLLLLLVAAVGTATAQRTFNGGQMGGPVNSSPGTPGTMQSGMQLGSLSGRVTGPDGRAVENARVELRSGRGSQAVNATYTNSNGAFEFANLPNGEYEVVVTQGLDEAQQSVSVQGPMATVDLRFSKPATPTAGGAQSVSIAEMKIPEKARSHYHKAEAAMRKQKFEEVAAELDKALTIAPNYANALTLHAVLHLDANHTEQALDDLQKAINSDPNYAMAYIVCGAVYNSAQQYDNAVRSLERGIALDPTSWQGYFELAKAQLAKQNYEASLRNVNRAYELAPKDYSPIHLVRAHVYLGMKDYGQAMTELESYLEHAPKDPVTDQARKTLDQVRAFVAAKK
jgi:tetratricopeptide (TPR) repeat protein